jgi:hypothetical protein
LQEVEDRAVVHAEAVVRARPEGGYQVALTTRTRTGERTRTLSATDCEVLADTVALVIAIAIDPAVAVASVEPPPARAEPAEPTADAFPPEAPAPPAEATRTPHPETPERPRPRGAVRPQPRGAVRVAGAGALGVLPGFAPGVDGAAALLLGRLRLELGFVWWFERVVDLVGADGRAGLRAWSLDVRGCFVPSVPGVEFPLCGGVEAGLMRGRGFDIDEPNRVSLPFVAIDLGPSIVWVPRRPVGLWMGVDLVVPVTRPAFSVDGQPPTHKPGSVAGTALLGVEGRFP